MVDGAVPAGRLVSIHIGEAGQALASVDRVHAVAGRGLEGDRYFEGRGTWSRPGMWSEITLIESEAIEALRAGGVGGDAADLRRNLVTVGVALQDLIGWRFRVGDVLLEGTRTCDPCRYLEHLAGRPGLKAALTGRGGLRARVVEGGTLRPGDAISRTVAAPPDAIPG